MPADDTIFIQIASYRDPQLVLTITDCIERAKYPENLRFTIAWQHGDDEVLPEIITTNPYITIIDIPYTVSKGACWARNTIQQNYNNEKFTLQLDSHHRFVQDWDVVLIDMYNLLKDSGVKRPLLTAYLPSFDPDNDPASRSPEPLQMDFDLFTKENVILFRPSSITDFKNLTMPVAARFYSAHFCFTEGKFSTEIQHDPEYYFHGEEISISARAYTHGYDLFHPHRLVAWHEYTRKARPKQWDEITTWCDHNIRSLDKNKKLFKLESNTKTKYDFSKYKLGTVRTLKEYEMYAGVCFKDKTVSTETALHIPPTGILPKNYSAWRKKLLNSFTYTIYIHKSERLKTFNYNFIYVGFKDEDGIEIYRNDVEGEELNSVFSRINSDDLFEIERTFIAARKPVEWVVWFHEEKRGWQQSISGKI